MNTPASRYSMSSRIATGGMGEVWLAEDSVLGREVAVKLLKREYAGDATFRSRFRTEARHAASLQHPNIATVFDFGESEPDDGGPPRPYLVMELVRGKALSELVMPDRPMAPERVRDLVTQAAGALALAHANGIVHRDVKPANLLVTPAGQVKVTDFGIARAADGVSLTATGEVLGTPYYLSPEQAQGRPATPASDVYALGVVLFECLTGRRPFAGDTPVITALAHLHDPVPDLPADIPADLAAVTRRALAKDPVDRYPDAGALAAALAGQHAAPTAASRVRPTPVATLTAPPPTAVLPASDRAPATPDRPDPAPDREEKRRASAWWPVAAVLVLALVAGVTYLVASAGPEGKPTREASAPATSATTGTTHLVAAGDYVGLAVDEARAKLRDLGFTDVRTITRNNPGDQDEDTVADISPTGKVDEDTTVTLTVWGPAPDSTPGGTRSPSPDETPSDTPSATATPSETPSGHAKKHGKGTKK